MLQKLSPRWTVQVVAAGKGCGDVLAGDAVVAAVVVVAGALVVVAGTVVVVDVVVDAVVVVGATVVVLGAIVVTALDAAVTVVAVVAVVVVAPPPATGSPPPHAVTTDAAMPIASIDTTHRLTSRECRTDAPARGGEVLRFQKKQHQCLLSNDLDQ